LNDLDGLLRKQIVNLTSENNKYIPSKINSGLIIRGTRSELPSRTTTVIRSTALTYDTIQIPISGRTANTADVASWYINDKNVLTVIPVGTNLITLYFGYVPYTIDFTTVLSSLITAQRNYSLVPQITSYNQNSVTIVDPGNFPSISNMYIQWGRNVITESYSWSDNNTVPQFTRPRFNNFQVAEINRETSYLSKQSLVVRAEPNIYYTVNNMTRSLMIRDINSVTNLVTGKTQAAIKVRGDLTSLDNFALKIFKLPNTKTQIFELPRHIGVTEVALVVREDSAIRLVKTDEVNVVLKIKDGGIAPLTSGIAKVNPIPSNRSQVFELPRHTGVTDVALVVRADSINDTLVQGVNKYVVFSLTTDRGFASTSVKLAMRDTLVEINQGTVARWIIQNDYIFDTVTLGSTTFKLPIRGTIDDQFLVGTVPIRTNIRGFSDLIFTDALSKFKPDAGSIQGFFAPIISSFNNQSIKIRSDGNSIDFGRVKLSTLVTADNSILTLFGKIRELRELNGDYSDFNVQKLVIKSTMNDSFSDLFVLTEGKLTSFKSKFIGMAEPNVKAPVPIQFWN
jgi:hypothetical protein